MHLSPLGMEIYLSCIFLFFFVGAFSCPHVILNLCCVLSFFSTSGCHEGLVNYCILFQSFNVTDRDLDDFFGGPAFLAWARMGNLHG